MWWQRVMVMGALAAAGVASPAAPAVAQQLDGAGGPADDIGPSTFTLDRMDAHTRLGMQVGFDKLEAVDLSDGFFMRFEPYGQLVLPNRMVGVYGALPISHAFDVDGDDQTGVGNLDVGAFFLPYQRSSLILRVGLVLPTASDGPGTSGNFLTSFERVTDVILSPPDYTAVRLSASTVQESGEFFFRGDFGFDLAVDKPANNNAVFLRANAAVGIRVPGVDVAAELANVGNVDGDGALEDRYVHTFAFGARTRGADQFHGGVVFPLDEGTRGEIWILSIGYQRAL